MFCSGKVNFSQEIAFSAFSDCLFKSCQVGLICDNSNNVCTCIVVSIVAKCFVHSNRHYYHHALSPVFAFYFFFCF